MLCKARRRRLTPIRALAIGCSSFLAMPVAAQDSTTSNDDDPLRQMQEQMRQLIEENREMRSEIDELRAATHDDWLTEQRAAEIRQIVSDVLADADRRTGFQNTGLTAGWVDGFFLTSPDGRFKLDVGGLGQVRWVQNFRDQNDRSLGGFEITRAKLTFSGHVFGREWTYMSRIDVTRDERGLVNGITFPQDVWLRRQIGENFAIRGGQFKLPFMREELVSSAHQMAVERSVLNETLTVARSQGIELSWNDDTWRAALAFSDGGTMQHPVVVAFLGSPAHNPLLNGQALSPDVEWAFTARYESLLAGTWQQFEDFTSPMGDSFGVLVGVGGHTQRAESNGVITAGRNEDWWYAATADISAEFGGASVFGSITHHYLDVAGATADIMNTTGVVIQGAIYITPKVELFGRYEYGNFDMKNSLARSDLHLITMGLNYYFEGHDLKWTTDIGIGLSQIEDVWSSDLAGWRAEGEGLRSQVVIRSQFQFIF